MERIFAFSSENFAKRLINYSETAHAPGILIPRSMKYMRNTKEFQLLVSQLPLRKLLFVAFLLAWVLFATVIPVPAPNTGSSGDGPM